MRRPKGGTYVLVNPDTAQIMRVGRTKDLSRRAREHKADPKTEDFDFVIDRWTDRYDEQRGREQLIHDEYQPPLDLISPISSRNPRRKKYLDAARKMDQGR